MTRHALNSRRGFTLAEVLIATTLAASLFAGLWTILGIFSKLQMRSETFAGRAQITRGLIAQIQDDLDRIEIPAVRNSQGSSSRNTDSPSSSVAPGFGAIAPIAGLPSGAAATTSAASNSQSPSSDSPQDEALLIDEQPNASQRSPTGVALRGSGSWMVMDLPMSSDELERHQQATSNQPQVPFGGDDSPRQPPSRKRVLYHYVSPELALVEDQLRVGLTRWEIPTTVSIDELATELNEGQFGTSKSRLWDQFALPSDGLSSIGDTFSTDASQLTGNPADELDIPREPIPEIERCLFRYYGENGWRQSWSSSETLPAALEYLVVWRDPKQVAESDLAEESDLTDPNLPTSNATSQNDSGSRKEELTEARLLAAWEQLGTEQFSSTTQELPPGFARYLFTLPSALVPDRSTLSDSDFYTAGTTSSGGVP